MTAVTKGFASRLGFGVGRTLRFFLNDRNAALRWVKRAVLGAALLLVLVNSFSWLLGSLLTLGCLGLALYALVKGDGGLLPRQVGTGWRYGPQGYGYYDMYGNCHPFGCDDE